jgi:hypothetical protein
MHADGRRSRQQSAKNDHRRGNRMRRWRWPFRRVMMSLPGCQQRTLDRIEQTLVAEDPGLGLRFAVFTRLTRHEAIPGTEYVLGGLQRPAMILPLMVISLVALLAVSWLIPSRQLCLLARTWRHAACQSARPYAASPARH